MFSPFVKTGLGVHTGQHVNVSVEVGVKGQGVVFVVDGNEIKAKPEFLCPAQERATTLAVGETRISTVEHLLAALLAFGECDVRIEVAGQEMPILDGSAAPWVKALRDAGATPGLRFVDIKEPLTVTRGDSWVRVTPIGPNTEPSIHLVVDFLGPPPLYQTITYHPLKDDFMAQIAPARTFAFESEIADLWHAGLARGGSLENALVIGSNGPINQDGLRFSDEPVRHKLLDALGDLSLLGGLPWADIELHKPGHRLLHELLPLALPKCTKRFTPALGAHP